MTVDRSGCSGSKHGNETAANHYGCSCSDARAERAAKAKARRVGLALRGPVQVDSTGVTRRLQALAAIGWSVSDIADQLGFPERTVERWRTGAFVKVSQGTATRVAGLYEQLQGTPGPSPGSRQNATRSGWAPPLAWDDSAIDNPAGRPLPVAGSPATGRLNLDDVKFLESCRESRDEIAKRMNVTVESIERAEYRAQERARASVERACAAIRAASDPAAPPAATPSSSRELELAR